MGRRFTAASSESITVGTAGLAGLNFRFGTFAMLLNNATLPAGASLINTSAVTATANPDIAAGVFGLWDGSITRTGQTLTANISYLIGYTKTTGTTTARFHSYRFDTNAWVHQASSGTSVDGVNPVVTMTIGVDGSTEYVDAEIWAMGLWQELVMTDSDFERLARGRWPEMSPDFYEQWTDGREVGDMMTTLGRRGCKQTARAGTSRGALKAPAGFRMAINRRRR